MNVKKIYYLICSLVLLSFIIGISFVLNSCDIGFDDNRSEILYIVAKVIFCSFYVFIMIKTVMGTENENTVIINIITIIAQCVPLLMRLFSQWFILIFIILAIGVVIYLALVLSFSLLSKKTKVAQKQLEGKTYNPKEDIGNEKRKI